MTLSRGCDGCGKPMFANHYDFMVARKDVRCTATLRVIHGRPLGVACGVSGLRRERRERHRYPFRRNPLGTPCHPTHLRTEGKPSNRCCLGRLKLRCRVERARPAQARGT